MSMGKEGLETGTDHGLLSESQGHVENYGNLGPVESYDGLTCYYGPLSVCCGMDRGGRPGTWVRRLWRPGERFGMG